MSTALPKIIDDLGAWVLDEAARPIGSMPKSEVHTADTPLHSAFSCYLIDDEDRIGPGRERGTGRHAHRLAGSERSGRERLSSPCLSLRHPKTPSALPSAR